MLTSKFNFMFEIVFN